MTRKNRLLVGASVLAFALPATANAQDEYLIGVTSAQSGYLAPYDQPAFAGFDEGRLGRLAPGMWADVTVMDRDLEATAPQEIDRARAAVTVVDGAVVWEA